MTLAVFFGTTDAKTVIPLHEGWIFKELGTKDWLSAQVPGVVQLDLLRHGRIPDPFIGTNEDSVQWIEKKNWTYQLVFECPNFDEAKRYHLHFDGLDTYAEVYLNGQKILDADNMFRQWEIEVTNHLKAKDNQLTVHFFSPLQVNRNKLRGLPYHRTAGNDRSEEKVSVYTRKAPFQFGWDWAPRLVTCGIWKPVYLVEWKEAKLKDVQFYQERLTPKSAIVRAVVDLQNDGNQAIKIRIRNKEKSAVLIEKIARPDEQMPYSLEFEIRNPQKWLPHHLGTPHLYKFLVELWKGEELLDTKEIRFGFRELALLRQQDAIGERFFFQLNGTPVFMKGANYVPMDPMLPRVTVAQKRNLLHAAKEAGINMLRIWGGGIYEEDEFYNICDSLGIMIWQDFMFACSMYPADKAFLKNIGIEIEDNVRRLRNHPSIVHWNGNNEVDVAWFNWGWQKAFDISEPDSIQMWQAYQTVFQGVIPDILKSIDPSRTYTHTSPLSNWGRKENFNRGTMHYWGVWHGTDALEAFRDNVGRFMVEYGFQSYPGMPTVRRFGEISDLNLASEVLKKRQKSASGNEKINQFIAQHFPQPVDFEDFVYKSQLTQLEGMDIAIKAHRKAMHLCGGSLFWQLNDTWPGPSWSSVDYFGRWKALHYRLKELFDNTLIIPELQGDSLLVFVATDQLTTEKAILQVGVFNFAGESITNHSFRLEILPNQSQLYTTIDLKPVLQKAEKEEIFIKIALKLPKSKLLERVNTLVPVRSLNLKKPNLQVQLNQKIGALDIISDTFVKGLYLEADGVEHFSNNYFDLAPNQKISIPFKGTLNSPSDLRLRFCNPKS